MNKIISFFSFSKKQWLVLGLMGLLTFSASLSYMVFANSYSGTFFGRESYRGYFNNNLDYYGSYVLPSAKGFSNVCNGQTGNFTTTSAFPSCINTTSELIQFLDNANGSTNSRRKTGAAFIYWTLMGYSGSSSRNKSITGTKQSNGVWTGQWGSLQTKLTHAQYDVTDNISASINSFYQDDSKDDAFYAESLSNESGLIITITPEQGGGTYTIKRNCANPIGQQVWRLAAATSVNKSQAIPGNTVTWTHKVTNSGPLSTSNNVAYRYTIYVKDLNDNLLEPSLSVNMPWSLDSGSSIGSYDSKTSTYSVKSSDAGKKICRDTVAEDTSSTNGAWLHSPSDCVIISSTLNYNLEPIINTNPSVIESGASFTVVPLVTNTGTTKSDSVLVKLTRIVTRPGSPSSAPTVDSDSEVFNTGPSAVLGHQETGFIDSSTVGYITGTKICYVLSVQPHSSNLSSGGADPASSQSCVMVGKKPKSQIWGGDLIVGGSTYTSTSDVSGARFGSWVEYAIFASDFIRGTASGSAFAGSPGGLAFNSSGDTACKYSKLSFSNATEDQTSCSESSIGDYSYSNFRTAPEIAASFTGTGVSISGTVKPNELQPSASGIYTSAGDLSLDSSMLSSGKSVIIKAPGKTVTIVNNQMYANGPYSSASQLPQLVIIADKIIINSGVTQVDAWLIAANAGGTGSIYTCEIQGKSSSQCSNQLVVNGPVVTDHLYLYRTAGSEPADNGKPAEIFNLRADAYLWAFARSSGIGRIQTVYTSELPPRF